MARSEATNLEPDRDKVVKVSEYAEAFIETVREKYKEMLKVAKTKEQDIKQTNNCFKIESQLLMARLQKFVSHMLLEAQKEMHKNMDFNKNRI